MSWYDRKMQRRANRGERGSHQRENYLAGHHIRRHGFAALIEKKSGEVIAVAKNGCFGRLAELDRDLYEQWALGTRAAS